MNKYNKDRCLAFFSTFNSKKLTLLAFIIIIVTTKTILDLSSSLGEKIIVVDENYDPISNAYVVIFGPKTYRQFSNQAGVVPNINLTGLKRYRFEATKTGYYRSSGFKYFNNETPVIMLRTIQHPVPLISKPLGFSHRGYNTEGWQSFDLIVGDYLPPYGYGKNADIEINAKYVRSDMNNYRSEIILRFPNPGDGLVEYQPDQEWAYSEIKSGLEAPLTGYTNTWECIHEFENGNLKQWTLNRDSMYYLRIRSKLDKNGNVSSAIYGRMDGYPNKDRKIYINPDINNRNVEFYGLENLYWSGYEGDSKIRMQSSSAFKEKE